MSCSLKEESFPPSVITFSTTAKDTSNVKWTPQSKKIEVINTTVGNSGNYTCTASNGYWTITLNYVLDIGRKFINRFENDVCQSHCHYALHSILCYMHDRLIDFLLNLML